MTESPDDVAARLEELFVHRVEEQGDGNAVDRSVAARQDDPVVLDAPDSVPPRPSGPTPAPTLAGPATDRPIALADLHHEVDELRLQLEHAFDEVIGRLTKLDLRITVIQTRVRPVPGVDTPEALGELDLFERQAALADRVETLASAVVAQTEGLTTIHEALGDLRRQLPGQPAGDAGPTPQADLSP